MIPFDFEYYKPCTIQEAIDLYRTLHADGKEPLYFCGGTEIITMARLNQLYTQAVIDIKDIPECTVLESNAELIEIGAAIPLAQLEEWKEFPLLSRVCNRIADHTSRYKITLGGNICGKIKYREAVLPLLIADSEITVASEDGLRKLPIHKIFNKQMNLNTGEFVVQAAIPKRYAEMPYITEKRTKIDRIDYPLITMAALRDGEAIRLSFSGLCEFPFRSQEIEKIVNDSNLHAEERARRSLNQIPAPVVEDINGSSDYRKFVFETLIIDVIRTLEGERP
ncbi:FAD binding domain-containing protein [Paenibacillus thiaminolyticus]|nr:FAD binding domain-containing protein [Paenibacillus thiaminolyticus]